MKDGECFEVRTERGGETIVGFRLGGVDGVTAGGRGIVEPESG